MSQLTKVSSHRKGYVKFGKRPYKDDWDPTVKVSYLTPDQLEAYKTKGEVQMSDVKTKSVEEYNSLLKQFEERGDLVNELQATVEKYKGYTAKLEQGADLFAELKSKYSTSERERKIAEENLTSANKSLRVKDAQVEQLERELSYARENERTLKANDLIFKAALKAAL
ncbi:hypothetical protein HMPREF3291_05200 [Bacillus sp. HMSC76G11]|nr:hypothetical protein HMPREF3291_05200 [Bacillus sp. HMSC76G11]